MELGRHNDVNMAAFVLAIRDWEERHGIWKYPANEQAQQAVNLGFTRTKKGQPAAIYSIPGEKDYMLVVLDEFTGAPRSLAKIKREDYYYTGTYLLH